MNTTGRYDAGDFLSAYITFMTTPGSHNDTYAESYHRDFFANYAQGVSPELCAGAEGHDTASIGGLVALPPVIVAAMREDDPAAVDRALRAHLRLTHRSTKLERYASALGQLLTRLLQDRAVNVAPLACAAAESFGFPATQVVERMRRERRSDLHLIGVYCLRQSATFGSRPMAHGSGRRPQRRCPNDQKSKGVQGTQRTRQPLKSRSAASGAIAAIVLRQILQQRVGTDSPRYRRGWYRQRQDTIRRPLSGPEHELRFLKSTRRTTGSRRN